MNPESRRGAPGGGDTASRLSRGRTDPDPREAAPGPPGDVPGVVPTSPTPPAPGLKSFELPTLEGIERRRSELLGLTLVVLLAFAGVVIVLSVFGVSAPIGELLPTARVLRAGISLLAIVFCGYVLDNEQRLRRLHKTVVNQQVLSAALANRLKEISLLSEAGKAVGSTLELEDVLSIILHAASELLESDEGSIVLLEGDELVVSAATGHARPFVGQRRPASEGPAGLVARSHEPLLLDERRRPEVGSRPDIASALLVPMLARAELLGVLNLNVTTGTRRYTEYELRALGLFAEHAAMAIRHARSMERERELRRHAVELDRVRTELVGSMTHDLKSPLTTILGSARMLLARSDVNEEVRRELLESIERQSRKLLELIDKLLGAARSQAQNLPLTIGPMDLVVQARQLAQGYANAHSRRIDVRAASERVVAVADADAVEQVLGNLLENAVRHTPPEASVVIELRNANGSAEVTVRDDGAGVDPELAASIFEPFRRSRGGTGLGLFVVSNLVRAMGGDIRLSSEPGHGAAFTFTLPSDTVAF